MFIGAELLLYYQPPNTATQNIKILVLTQSFLGGTVLGLANLPLVWIRKNCLAVQTPYTTREDIDVSIWISNSFLHFKQMNFRKNGTYVSDKKAGKKKSAPSGELGVCPWEKPRGRVRICLLMISPRAEMIQSRPTDLSSITGRKLASVL